MKSIEQALAIFEESAIVQGHTFETGDYKKGNKYHKLEIQSVVCLCEHRIKAMGGWRSYLPYQEGYHW